MGKHNVNGLKAAKRLIELKIPFSIISEKEISQGELTTEFCLAVVTVCK